MKLQKLLDKHKHNLWDWCDAILYEKWQIYVNYWKDTVDIETALWQFSLSDLLFSTPFLSLLEWRQTEQYYICYPNLDSYYESDYHEEKKLSSIEYHKINLVLLNSDAERIEYIEKFTL